MKVTEAELEKHQIPNYQRDYCAHLLIPLNKCRFDNYSLPFKCTDQRHAYEKCQYEEYVPALSILSCSFLFLFFFFYQVFSLFL